MIRYEYLPRDLYQSINNSLIVNSVWKYLAINHVPTRNSKVHFCFPGNKLNIVVLYYLKLGNSNQPKIKFSAKLRFFAFLCITKIQCLDPNRSSV